MLLHLTSPHMKGQEVLAVQTRLKELGYAPGALDSDYGPTTAAAVQRFQAANGFAPDGIVREWTWSVLMASSAIAQGEQESTLGLRAKAEAIKHLGVSESPPNSNLTLFGEWFGVNGVPWCNIFVSYCFYLGAGYEICKGFKGPGVKAGKGCAYVPTTEAWLRGANLWVGRTEPSPGDIAVYNWDNTGVPEHIGIVEAFMGNGQFSAIEGNTSLSNDSNGGTVMRRIRKISQVDGFGRII